LKFTDVPDGLSYTLLIGEKFVHVNYNGQGEWGDVSLWSDDHSGSIARVAGPGHPLALSDDDPSVLQSWYKLPFGGPHVNICQFVFCDGSVTALSTAINTTVLGYLARRHDGKAIPGNAF